MYPFHKIVSIDGFYFSGSGAVVDLLKEFNNTSVFSFEDDFETKTPSYEKSYGEIYFYSLFHLNKLRQAFINKDIHLFDQSIKRIIWEYYCLRQNKCLIHIQSPFYKTEEFKNYSEDLLLNILELTEEDKNFIKSVPDFYFPVHVKSPSPQICVKGTSTFFEKLKKDFNFSFQKDRHYLYQVKKTLSLEQFDSFLIDYLKKIFTYFDNVNNQQSSLIVLDQLLCRQNICEEKNLLQDAKQITVIRDPRDMYYWINTQYVDFDKLELNTWINTTNKEFTNIKQSENRLVIILEDLVFNYDITVKKICNFLGLTVEQHINKYKYFDPEISKHSIGVWKKYPIPEVMEYIHKNAIKPSELF